MTHRTLAEDGRRQAPDTLGVEMTMASPPDSAELFVATGGSGRERAAAFTSQPVFDAEMRRVFESGWIYLAHESEVPTPGDYKTGTIGVQPIVITRHENGQIYALLNRCRHRGMVVCRAAAGHSHYLRCAYHNWTYAADGTLVGVAQADGYPDDFDKSRLPLQQISQVGVYRGFIFGNLSQDRPTLDEHLAPVRSDIDAWLSRSPVGSISVLATISKQSWPGNWKLQAEATSAVHDIFVFPNLCLSDAALTVITPVEVELTELARHAYALDGVSPHLDGARDDARGRRFDAPDVDNSRFDDVVLPSFYEEWKRRMNS